MNRIWDGWASVIALAVAVWFGIESISYRYMTALGPGPGFFPLWLSIALAALSIAWFIQSRRVPKGVEEAPREAFLPVGPSRFKAAAILVCMLFFIVAVEFLGYSLTSFVMMLALLPALGQRKPIALVLVALGSSFGFKIVFGDLLGVQLPEASIAFLRNLGL